MKAIILAGGRGTRLEPYTRDLPKCMLELQGRSLLERQVDTLRGSGIDNITVVSGYAADKINIPNVTRFHNPDFATTNMVETLMCARSVLSGEVLVCYADILYEPDVVATMIASHAPIGVCVDEDYWEYWQARHDRPEDDLETLVVDHDGNITELGSPCTNTDRAQVRYVGLIRLSAVGCKTFLEVYDTNRASYDNSGEPWLNSASFKKAYMTCMLTAIIRAGYPVSAIPIRRGWLEFDTVDDYERVTRWIQGGTLDRFMRLST